MNKFKNLIGGEWVDSSSGATFEDRNPANPEELIGTFPMAEVEDVRRAIAAARTALPGWANLPPPKRGAILDQASQIITARLDEIASALTREEGKTLAEAKGEVLRARDILRYYSGEGWRAGGNVLPSDVEGELLYTRREPLGVVSLITPWNFPIAIPAWKIAPALAYGNTIVFKPAEDTPYIGLLLVQALVEAGLPPGVVNLLTGSGPVVGGEMVSNPGVDGVSFTGSYAVGTSIYSQAIKNMTRVQLEMGGKNALIVLDDAPLDRALNIAVRGGFGLTGQACTATSRVIVAESIADEFAQALTAASQRIVVGNGLEPNVRMGPAVNREQLEQDLHYVRIGKDEGARLLAGGEVEKRGGFFVQPTVFDRVEPGMHIAQEEIFGPVIGIIRAKNIDDAIEKANAIHFGLTAGIVTNDLHKAFTFANRIEAGVVKVNEPTTGLSLQAPFGGFKDSSANTFKEQGSAALEFYTRTKTIYMGY